MTATQAGTGYRLDGVKKFVLDGHSADLIVVVARWKKLAGWEGLSFFTIGSDAAGREQAGAESDGPDAQTGLCDLSRGGGGAAGRSGQRGRHLSPGR